MSSDLYICTKAQYPIHPKAQRVHTHTEQKQNKQKPEWVQYASLSVATLQKV